MTKLWSVVLLLSLAACSPDATESLPAATDTVAASDNPLDITVYKSPTCGCCNGWVTYLEEEGFAVTAINHDDVDAIKKQLGLPDPELKSCHTAVIDGYLVEGHVPANDILRLLSERPAGVRGLSAPGMPMMSPGMASRTPKDYAVLSFKDNGDTAVFSQY